MPEHRERSRSPVRTAKLHVSNLPVGFPVDKLSKFFSQFGPVLNSQVIRSGPKGRLTHFNYGFVEMERDHARTALDFLANTRWSVSFSRHSQVSAISDADLIWSGFLSRSLTKRVGVDAYLIRGSFQFDPRQYHIDIPYRVPLDSVLINNAKALLIFEAENSTQFSAFEEYIQYFKSRDRAGYVPLNEKEMLYLVASGELAKEVCELGKNQILGVVVPVDNN